MIPDPRVPAPIARWSRRRWVATAALWAPAALLFRAVARSPRPGWAPAMIVGGGLLTAATLAGNLSAAGPLRIASGRGPCGFVSLVVAVARQTRTAATCPSPGR